MFYHFWCQQPPQAQCGKTARRRIWSDRQRRPNDANFAILEKNLTTLELRTRFSVKIYAILRLAERIDRIFVRLPFSGWRVCCRRRPWRQKEEWEQTTSWLCEVWICFLQIAIFHNLVLIGWLITQYLLSLFKRYYWLCVLSPKPWHCVWWMISSEDSRQSR